MNKLELDYNSTYVSLNLIDELDYVIGEYGKPNLTFIYTLNAFLEAFVLNSIFYISEQEFKHMQLLSKSLFPSGRPILELLSKTNSMKAISGIGNNIGQVVSIIKHDTNNPISYQEKIAEFIENGIDTKIAREKYLTLSDLNRKVEKLKFLNIGKVEDGLIALESTNTPEDFFNALNKATYYSNVQSVLPFYSYKQQITQTKIRGISKEIITGITNIFEKKQDAINQYFGCSNQQIPPLVNILLSQCNSINDIPDKLLQLRHDFTNLRKSIITYEKRINESHNIKEQIDALEEYNEFWKLFNKKYTNSSRLVFNFWDLAEDSNLDQSIDNAIDSGSYSNIVEDLNLGKVIGKSVKKLLEYSNEKRIINRFRGITDLWKLFNDSPNVKDQIKNYERIFNVELYIESIDRLKKN